MPGFEAWNSDHSVLPVSSAYRNLVLAKKGTVVTAAPPADNPPVYWNGDNLGVSGIGLNGGISPIAFVRCTSVPAAAFSLGSNTQPGGNWNWSIAAKGIGYSVDYWIFDDAVNGLIYDSDSAHMEAYTQGGAKTYDSRMRPMSIGFYENRGGSGETFSSAIDYPTGHTWAVAQTSYWGGGGNKNNIAWNFILCYRMTASQIIYEGVRYYGAASLVSAPFNVINKVLIADVTGL